MKSIGAAFLMVTAGGTQQALADPPINLVTNSISTFTPKAVPDASWGITNCVVSGGSATVYCPAPANITMASSGAPPQYLVADDVGSGRTPLVAKISSISPASGTMVSGIVVSNGINLTLSSAASYGNAVSVTSGGSVVPLANHVPGVIVSNGGSGYEFTLTQTISCATSCTTSDGHHDTSMTPSVMSEVPGTGSVVSSAGGTGGTAGYCSALTPVSEVGINGGVVEFGGMISSGALSNPLTLVSSGLVTADTGAYSLMTGKYTEKFVGCGFTSATGPTIGFKYGVVSEQVMSGGAGLYAQTAPCVSVPVATASADGGSGLTVSCGGTLSYPGTVAFGTDNTSAFRAALGSSGVPSGGTMNAGAATGKPECLYLPAGNYLTQPLNQYTAASNQASGPNIAKGYGCWLGDEHYHSNVFVIPNVGGDVFAWTDSGQNGSIVNLGNTQTFSNFQTTAALNTPNQAGASFKHLNIIGNRLSTLQQNGLAMYGPTQFADIENVVVDYLFGRGFYGGGADAAGAGEFSESIIQDARFEDDGINSGPVSTAPTFEITASGTTEGSNTDSLTNIRIFQSIGTAFWLHSAGSSNTRLFRLSNIVVEGSSASSVVNGGDLMLLGDPAQAMLGSNVSDIVGRNIQLANPVVNFAALRVTANTLGTLSQNSIQALDIDIEGIITAVPNVLGRGLQVETCTHCYFRFADNNTTDYNLVIGARTPPLPCTNSAIGSPATTGLPGVTYDGELGYLGTSVFPSHYITTCFDPAAPLVSVPVNSSFQ